MIHIKLMVYNFDIFDYIDYTSLALYVAEFEINTKCYFLISSHSLRAVGIIKIIFIFGGP